MSFVGLAAIITLGLASVYAAYVWTGEARQASKRGHPGTAAGYSLLGLCNVSAVVIIGSTIIGHPLTLPQGTATLLLFPIIAVPAFLVHRARRRSSSLIDEARRG